MKAALISAAILALALTEARAQTQAYHVRDLHKVLGSDFFSEPSGTLGLVAKTGCGTRETIDNRAIYLIDNHHVFWGIGAQEGCIRFVINHRAIGPDSSPTYLSTRIVGLYADEQQSQIILRREGDFLRNGVSLGPFRDKILDADTLNEKDFNDLHNARVDPQAALAELDRRVGRKWHGVPAGSKDDSWADRRSIAREERLSQSVKYQSRVLDQRLYRFEPFPEDGKPSRVLDFLVRPKGARAVVISVFSPASVEYRSDFLLVFSDDEKTVDALLKDGRANRLPLLAWLFGLLAQ